MIDSPVALITGGGSGIGAAVARQLLGAGHRVAVTGRGEARLRGFAEELGDPDGLLTIVGDAARPRRRPGGRRGHSEAGRPR
jgi:NADP-dependent 3-hydroxy acid dehydrogenase YdfG